MTDTDLRAHLAEVLADPRTARQLGWARVASEAYALLTELDALRAVAGIVRRHTHWGLYAMTLHAGPNPEEDCHLCRALVAAGVLTLDGIGAGTRAALAKEAGHAS